MLQLFFGGIVLGVIWWMLLRYLWTEYHNHRTQQAPAVTTYRAVFELMDQYLDIAPQSVCGDMGCGTGQVLRFFVRRYHIRRGLGCDNNAMVVYRARFCNRWGGYRQLTIRCQDMWTVDWSECDLIYLFLLPTQCQEFVDWRCLPYRSDRKIVAAVFPLPEREAHEIITSPATQTKIFVYYR